MYLDFLSLVLHFINLDSRAEKHLYQYGPSAYLLILSSVAYYAMFIEVFSIFLKKKSKLFDEHGDTYFMPPR